MAKAVIVRWAKNRKLGADLVETFVSIRHTCPECLLGKRRRCYVLAYPPTNTLDRNLGDDADQQGLVSGVDWGIKEARAIERFVRQEGVPAGTPCRLHVGGDFASIEHVQYVAATVERHGLLAWAYTRRWREIPASAFGPVQIFASVHDERKALEAVRRGYTPALYIDGVFPNGSRYWTQASGIEWQPCPEQTSGLSCVECRMCFREHPQGGRYFGDWALNRGIAFADHRKLQASKRKGRVHLSVIKEAAE